ncbi:hypothetical protein L2E82_36253 [Cichorium intybus]|uniref:Uncharacterized protein n=1 Tax=Cichorium intybus TaxID=13427 RepID=A0ACB9BR44_CICIN|nr:hypothetical protein L2E82_36253 [Cichorium intybus]
MLIRFLETKLRMLVDLLCVLEGIIRLIMFIVPLTSTGLSNACQSPNEEQLLCHVMMSCMYNKQANMVLGSNGF